MPFPRFIERLRVFKRLAELEQRHASLTEEYGDFLRGFFSGSGARYIIQDRDVTQAVSRRLPALDKSSVSPSQKIEVENETGTWELKQGGLGFYLRNNPTSISISFRFDGEVFPPNATVDGHTSLRVTKQELEYLVEVLNAENDETPTTKEEK